MIERDLTGKIINGITVIKKLGKIKGTKILWLCRCHCGKEFTPSRSNLMTNKIRSCGCLRIKLITKHNDHKTVLYRCWTAMKGRCTNPNNPEYKNYGARGITFCERWSDYMLFKEDMLSSFKTGLSLDRKDNNGNYEKDNCKWSTNKEQQRNTRRNRYFDTPFGKITLTELSEKSGIQITALRSRIKYWKNPSYQQLTRPVQKHIRKPKLSAF